MKQSDQRCQRDVWWQISPARLYASRLGSFVDAVLRGLDRIFGGLARPVLEPVPARIPHSQARRRS